MKHSMKYYYIDRILDVATKHNLDEYTFEKLDIMTEDNVIALWDSVRWNHSDLKGIRN